MGAGDHQARCPVGEAVERQCGRRHRAAVKNTQPRARQRRGTNGRDLRARIAKITGDEDGIARLAVPGLHEVPGEGRRIAGGGFALQFLGEAAQTTGAKLQLHRVPR
ncbi:hypothetical protein D9M70_524420 [compost metagenome]